MDNKKHQKKKRKKGLLVGILVIELIILVLIFGTYKIYVYISEGKRIPGLQNDTQSNNDKLSQKELELKEEQERLQKEFEEMKELVNEANLMAKGYAYEEAIQLLKEFTGSAGGYELYTYLVDAVNRLEKEKASLVLFGGEYSSVFEVSHLYFNPLIADPDRAFDGDRDARGYNYNMYNITVNEFKAILQTLYDQGYVLISMADIANVTTKEDGSIKYEPNKIYLRKGKKPIIISENDLSYHKYMQDDGFASKLVLDEEGKVVCELQQADGSVIRGAYDMVPIVNDFIKEHPDFSYKGAKGVLTLTGYDGVFGYRTNDKNSSGYEADKEAAMKVAQALWEDGWELACHSWGYKDMKAGDLDLLTKDTQRWFEEVGSLVGPTDIYVFPFGNDIESASGTYKSDKYKFLKSSGFNVFLGVYKEPWLHVKTNYVRMTRRPIDGQALLEFPERLTDLFAVDKIIDPARPAKDWQ